MALIAAAEAGDEGGARAALDAGVRADTTDAWGATALHAAATNGREAIATLLLERGAEVDARDGVRAAAARGVRHHPPRMHARKTHLSRDLPLLLRARCRAQGGVTPLGRAADAGQEALVALLLSRGADVAAKDNVRAPFCASAPKSGVGRRQTREGPRQ